MEIERIPLTDINIDNLIEECGIEKEKAKELINNYRKNYYNYQHSLIDYNKFNESFSENVTIYGNKEYFLTNIKFSKKELLTKICRLLNIKESKNLTEDLNKRIEELKHIKTEEELKSFSPLIYEDFKKGQTLYKEFTTVNDFIKVDKSISEEEKRKEIKLAAAKEKYYYRCGLRYILSYFIEEQSKIYTNLVNHLVDFNNAIDKASMNNIVNYLDKDKTKFYLVNKYLEECFLTKDPGKLNIYLSLIDKYLNQVKNHDLVIHNEYGTTTTIKDFIAIYRNFTNHDKLITNWELIPNGTKTNTNQNTNHRLIKNSDNLEKYLNLNNKKLKLYERSPYIGKAKGLCLNEGYTAYFYENGEIILDRIADSSNNLSTGYGNAIYNLNSDNFIELSSIDKTTLREEDLCPHFNHSGYWEKRIQDIIEIPPTESTITKSNNLIKILKATH